MYKPYALTVSILFEKNENKIIFGLQNLDRVYSTVKLVRIKETIATMEYESY